ncbi:MAG: PD40 domain-containing protein [Acidobacteria bacterium]|nr:PD40 domain-containing protein [Acidobacteriota bacterium]
MSEKKNRIQITRTGLTLGITLLLGWLAWISSPVSRLETRPTPARRGIQTGTSVKSRPGQAQTTQGLTSETRGKFTPNATVSVEAVSLAVPPFLDTVSGRHLLQKNAMSFDGRFIVYKSDSPNLVVGQIDSNSTTDIFVFDRQTGIAELVSRVAGTTATAGSSISDTPVISANGRYVAYQSFATNLVTGQTDTNSQVDIFVFDRQTGITELVSRAAGTTTTTGNSDSQSPVISDDGRYILFVSRATNLVPGQADTNGVTDVFIFDRQTGTTELVSRVAGTNTTAANNESVFPVMSVDGRYIAFQSRATNVVPGQTDTNNNSDIFVIDRQTGITQIVSHADGAGTTTGNGVSNFPVINANGRYIVFGSTATNLVTGQSDVNAATDIFVFDQLSGTITLVSRAAGTTATTANNQSGSAIDINADGRIIVFQSVATNLVTGQTDSANIVDVFVFDRQAGTTELVSRAAGTTTTAGDGHSLRPLVDSSGRYIVFESLATNLITGQTEANNGEDVFVFDRLMGITRLVSRAAGTSATTGNQISFLPVISRDANSIVFVSEANDLVSGIVDVPRQDIFIYDQIGETNSVVTQHAPGSPSLTGSDSSALTTLNSISPDGRYLVFVSTAVNLVSGQIDTLNTFDIFVFDRQTGATELVSRVAGTSTMAGNGNSNLPVISADGRYITFNSDASNLVSGQLDTNNGADVFVFDRQTGTTELVSRAVGTNFTTGNSPSVTPTMSADGRYIAFQSDATNLVSGQLDTNNGADVFVFDRQTGTSEIVSRAAGTSTTTGNRASIFPVMSADGGYIALTSFATNLVPGQSDTNNDTDVFVFDRQTGTTDLVSHAAGQSVATGNMVSASPVINADGRYVVFTSNATNLVPGQSDANNAIDVFVFDRQGGTTELVSRAAGLTATTGNASSSSAVISSDGGSIAFQSVATNLVPGQNDTNSTFDIFVLNRQTGITELISRTPGMSTQVGNGSSMSPTLNANGTFVAFVSFATNLVPGQTDAPSTSDIFVFDRTNQEMVLLSGAGGSPTIAGNSSSQSAVINASGQYIGFSSSSSNLIAGDYNLSLDVFLAEFCPTVTATVGGSGPICTGSSTTVTATILGGTPPYTVTLTSGGGTQTGNSPLIFPVAPDATTTYAIQSGTDASGCPITGNGSVQVMVVLPPTVTAGSDQTVCTSSLPATLAGSIGGSATMGTWSGGGGTFNPGPTALNARYMPSASEIAAGIVTLTLTTNDPGGVCSPVSDTVTIFILNCAETGQLLVADTANNRIQRFDGTTWSLIGSGVVGSGAGQFRLPEAVTFNGAGRIYVADTGNNRIQWSTDDGATWANFATVGSASNQVRSPQGVCLDSAGNLYVSDTGNGRVVRFNSGTPGAGVVIASNGAASGQVGSPHGLVINSTFRLFVTDESNSRILSIASANTVTTSTSGTILASQGTGLNKVKNPQGITIDEAGTLYIADTGNSRILRWVNANPNNSSALATIGSLLGQVNRAEGITTKFFTSGPFAGSWMLVVGDSANNRIQGKFIQAGGWSLVGAPNNVGSGTGQFRTPSKIQ